MASITDTERVLRNLIVKLYPNYLPQAPGAFIARTKNNKVLSVKDVCDILVTRAGFTGNPEDLYDCVCQYLDEVAYQLCDGMAINNKYYYLYPNVGGTFDSASEAHDHKKHPLGIRFSIRARLRRILKNVNVIVDGMADVNGYIDQYVDLEEGATNTLFMIGNMFAVHGHKIKIAGDHPDNGVWFVPVDAPDQAVKVLRVGENKATRVTGIAEDTHYADNRIEIRTQYNGSKNSFLKAPRVITSPFTLEMG